MNSPTPSKRNGAVSLQSMTEAEFEILVSCKKGLKELAGRRRTVGETLVEKNTGYWRPSRRETRIEYWSLQSAQNRDSRHPLSGIPIHVLPHCMCISTLGSDSVRNRQPEGASRQTEGQPADGQDDDEDAPVRMLVTRESQVLGTCH